MYWLAVHNLEYVQSSHPVVVFCRSFSVSFFFFFFLSLSLSLSESKVSGGGGPMIHVLAGRGRWPGTQRR